jgi:DNA (cytosine-5)-methyltransferase 1
MSKKLKVIDLFSGIGGFSLGLERTGGFETVAFCEIDPYCRKVLRKHWPDVPIHEDVRTLKGDEYGPVDLICGGYPCQPFSNAGERRGAEDDRHLWPEVHRLVVAVRPAWCLFENVAGHITLGLDEVLSDLENEGYTTQPLVIPACALDAPHRRDRVWILANSNGGRRDTQPLPSPQRDSRENNLNTDQSGKGSRTRVLANPGHTGVLQRKKHGDGGENGHIESGVRRNVLSGREQGKVLADASSGGLQGRSEARNNSSDRPKPRNEQFEGLRGVYEPRTSGQARWLSEPNVGRVAYGVPNRVDRLKALGNAVVPQIPEIIGRAILGATS